MQLAEASLTFQTIHFDAADRLVNTTQILAYLTDRIPAIPTESFWILCLNPNRRPICRIKIATSNLVTTRVSVRDIILPTLLAEGKGLVCLRTQPEGLVRPNLADGRLMFTVQQACRLMGIEFLDYLIARLDQRDCYSCRQHGELHD